MRLQLLHEVFDSQPDVRTLTPNPKKRENLEFWAEMKKRRVVAHEEFEIGGVRYQFVGWLGQQGDKSVLRIDFDKLVWSDEEQKYCREDGTTNDRQALQVFSAVIQLTRRLVGEVKPDLIEVGCVRDRANLYRRILGRLGRLVKIGHRSGQVYFLLEPT